MQNLALNGPKLEKFSKAQRRRFEEAQMNQCATSDRFRREPDAEDLPSQKAEKVMVVVSCENVCCEQYNKIKVLELPRIKTPSVKVDLSD
jgi:hypothetical protein